MFSLFILLIVVIGVVSTIGFAILSLIKTGENSLTGQKTQAQIEVLAKVIAANVRQKDGHILVPVEIVTQADPEDLEDDAPRQIIASTIPSFAPYKTTAAGAEITYCPVGSSGSPDPLVTTTTGHLSPENQFEVYSEGGQNFVVTGKGWLNLDVATKARDHHMVALILVPGPQASSETDPLLCKDVTTNEDVAHMFISGGSVTPIYAVHSGASHLVARTSEQLENALRKIAFEKPYSATIRIAESITVPVAERSTMNEALNAVTSDLLGRTLIIDGGAARRNIQLEGDAIEVTGNLELRSMSVIHSFVSRPSGNITSQNTITGPLVAQGGSILVEGDSEIRATGSEVPVIVEGGNVRIEDLAAINHPSATDVFVVEGGRLHFVGEPLISGGAGTNILALTGNGSITGSGASISVQIDRGSGFTSEKIYPVDPVKISESCSGIDCTATCTGETKVVAGYCQTEESSLTGNFINDDMSSFTCNWAMPVLASEAVAFCR